MNINIQTRNFQDNKSLIKTYIKKKLSQLSNYYDEIVYADVYLKMENASSKENQSIELRFTLPGDDLIVNKSRQNFK
ncbi:MAG: HPF/RaiA family ribosome-associated protein [Flavobacteriales bacterium]